MFYRIVNRSNIEGTIYEENDNVFYSELERRIWNNVDKNWLNLKSFLFLNIDR